MRSIGRALRDLGSDSLIEFRATPVLVAAVESFVRERVKTAVRNPILVSDMSVSEPTIEALSTLLYPKSLR